jgi:ADP-ribose pyrophosphatase
MRRKSASRAVPVYSNPFMDVHHTRAEFDGFHKDYFVVDLGPRAGVVAVRDGAVLLTRQYRFLPDDYSWELPGGRVDPGESADVAARRECLEETGIECPDLRQLVEYYPGLDNFDNRTTIYLCEQPRTARAFVPVPSEVVEIRWAPFDEALDMVARGAILDALTVTGILAVRALRALP